MSTVSLSDPCPCGRKSVQGKLAAYGRCCGQWLESDRAAPDAEALMRSRYSAFVLERAQYLRNTWHPATRPASVEFDARVKWLGLEVRSHSVQDPTHAQVEFVARQKTASQPAVRLHERSRFVLEQGAWLYVDGDLG